MARISSVQIDAGPLMAVLPRHAQRLEATVAFLQQPGLQRFPRFTLLGLLGVEGVRHQPRLQLRRVDAFLGAIHVMLS
jgi:hypothetical protein